MDRIMFAKHQVLSTVSIYEYIHRYNINIYYNIYIYPPYNNLLIILFNRDMRCVCIIVKEEKLYIYNAQLEPETSMIFCYIQFCVSRITNMHSTHTHNTQSKLNILKIQITTIR